MKYPIIAEMVGYEEVHTALKGRLRWVSKPWSDIAPKELAAANQKLERFGYRLVQELGRVDDEMIFTLYQGEKPILEHFHLGLPIEVNQSKTDFMLNAKMYNYLWKQVRKDQIIEPKSAISDSKSEEDWPMAMPRFLGDNILTLKMQHSGRHTTVRIYNYVEVERLQ
jgi:hypothetical protein